MKSEKDFLTTAVGAGGGQLTEGLVYETRRRQRITCIGESKQEIIHPISTGAFILSDILSLCTQSIDQLIWNTYHIMLKRGPNIQGLIQVSSYAELCPTLSQMPRHLISDMYEWVNKIMRLSQRFHLSHSYKHGRLHMATAG